MHCKQCGTALGVNDTFCAKCGATISSIPEKASMSQKIIELAKKGNATAQSNLGVLYAKGQGVEKNLLQSYAWFKIASDNGHKTAKENAEKIKLKFTKEQLQEATEVYETIASATKITTTDKANSQDTEKRNRSFYCFRNKWNREVGPVSLDYLKEALVKQEINKFTPVRRKEQSEWLPLGERVIWEDISGENPYPKGTLVPEGSPVQEKTNITFSNAHLAVIASIVFPFLNTAKNKLAGAVNQLRFKPAPMKVALLLVGLICSFVFWQFLNNIKFYIEPQFDNAWSFNDGLAPVEVKGKWGAIDKTGRIIIEPKYDQLFPFQDGLALIILSGQYGFIDRKGEYVIRPTFRFAHEFSDGLARVTVESTETSPIHGGPVTTSNVGYIDKSGKYVIQPMFWAAGDFSEGLAGACYETKNLIINMAGKPVALAQLRIGFEKFSDGLMPGRDIDSKYGYINKDGIVVIEPVYDMAFNFSDGLAPVKKFGKWGFIDTNGYYVIKPKFVGAGSFFKGLAGVKESDKWGVIDKTGSYIIKPIFDKAGGFSDGFARVEVNMKWGFIDTNGKYVIKPEFDDAGEYKEGLAPVKINGKWGYIEPKMP